MSALRAAGVIKNEEQWMKPIYQGEGLGSLLIAVSAVALNRQGIGGMSLGSLSEMAKRAWETFDRGGRSQIPTQELANHPKTRDAIGRFISP